MTQNPKTLPVKISVDVAGIGTYEVDGHDISHLVAGVSVQAHVGDITRIVMDKIAKGGVELDIEGIVAFRDQSDPEGLHAAFDAIDPESIEKAALASLGMGDGGGTKAIIEEVRKVIAGERPG